MKIASYHLGTKYSTGWHKILFCSLIQVPEVDDPCPGYLGHPFSKQGSLRRSGVVGRRSERESHDRNACFGTDVPSSQHTSRMSLQSIITHVIAFCNILLLFLNKNRDARDLQVTSERFAEAFFLRGINRFLIPDAPTIFTLNSVLRYRLAIHLDA